MGKEELNAEHKIVTLELLTPDSEQEIARLVDAHKVKLLPESQQLVVVAVSSESDTRLPSERFWGIISPERADEWIRQIREARDECD